MPAIARAILRPASARAGYRAELRIFWRSTKPDITTFPQEGGGVEAYKMAGVPAVDISSSAKRLQLLLHIA